MLEKTLESPLGCKEIQPVHSEGDQPWDFFGGNDAEATSCKELTHWKRLWCWEGLGAGGEGEDRGWDGWMHHQLDGCDVSLSELLKLVMDREAWRAAIHGVAKSPTQLSNWTELNWKPKIEIWRLVKAWTWIIFSILLIVSSHSARGKRAHQGLFSKGGNPIHEGFTL